VIAVLFEDRFVDWKIHLLLLTLRPILWWPVLTFPNRVNLLFCYALDMAFHVRWLCNIIDCWESLTLLQNSSKRTGVNFWQMIAWTVLFHYILFRISIANVRKFVTFRLKSCIYASIFGENLVIEWNIVDQIWLPSCIRLHFRLKVSASTHLWPDRLESILLSERYGDVVFVELIFHFKWQRDIVALRVLIITSREHHIWKHVKMFWTINIWGRSCWTS